MRVADARSTPCCAGVLVTDRDMVLLTLGSEERWEPMAGGGVRVPVSGIGGGQNAGETMIECACREALEETGCSPLLVHSPTTYVELSPRTIEKTTFGDDPAPFLYQVRLRSTAEPYSPNLPSGLFLHIAIYRARLQGEPAPVDVPGLAWVPLNAIEPLEAGLRLDDAAVCGIRLRLRRAITLPPGTILSIPFDSTERLLGDVVRRFGAGGIAA